MVIGSIRRMLARFGVYRPRVGDVIVDAWDQVEKTIEGFSDNRARVVWFDGPTLRRGSLLTRRLRFVR